MKAKLYTTKLLTNITFFSLSLEITSHQNTHHRHQNTNHLHQHTHLHHQHTHHHLLRHTHHLHQPTHPLLRNTIPHPHRPMHPLPQNTNLKSTNLSTRDLAIMISLTPLINTKAKISIQQTPSITNLRNLTNRFTYLLFRSKITTFPVTNHH